MKTICSAAVARNQSSRQAVQKPLPACPSCSTVPYLDRLIELFHPVVRCPGAPWNHRLMAVPAAGAVFECNTAESFGDLPPSTLGFPTSRRSSPALSAVQHRLTIRDRQERIN